MTVDNYANTFHGKPVLDFRSGDKVKRTDAVYRLCQEYESKESQQDLLSEFLLQLAPGSLEALIIGPWANGPESSPAGYLELLVKRAAELSSLRALFVGDLTSEDNEISWIIQTDYSKLLAAYPTLEVLRIRGSGSLVLPAFEHHGLRELVIECGGLPSKIVDAIAKSTLPALRKLELWLGTDEYGFDGTLASYVNLLERIRPERLGYLGLRNAQISDEIAVHVAKQAWLGRINTLDLSMGTLGDVGAKALLESPYIAGLKVLNLRHHYISAALVTRLKTLKLSLLIDAAEEEDDGERYVQVSE